MAHEWFRIDIAEDALTIPPTDLLSLEVELDTELASMFRLRLAIRQQRNGLWTYLDEERFSVWKPMRITAGFDSGSEELISGFITHVKPDFPRDPAQCSVEIWGMDGSVRMDRVEKLRAWPNMKDSDIATQIFEDYGFIPPDVPPDVDDTGITHDDRVSTIMQRETDMQFLKRLAQRNGFECYVKGTTGCFHAPRLSESPQPVLAVHFGERETNVNSFSLEVNALTPTRAAMFEVDWQTKTVLQERAEIGEQALLGSIDATELSAPEIAPGKVFVNLNATTGRTEMDRLCQELVNQAEWLVTAEGEIDGNQYAHVLKPHGTVTIKGIGETYSGIYYVTHVTHTFGPRGYTQSFRAKRNALMPTGEEDFTGLTSKPNPYLLKPNPYL